MAEVREVAGEPDHPLDAGDVEALEMVAICGEDDLSGRVGIVTGGGRGIGRLVGEGLAGAGGDADQANCHGRGSMLMRGPVSRSPGERPEEPRMEALPDPTPVLGLFETHLTVHDLQRSIRFYREVVGLPLALEVPERGAAFFWIGRAMRSMLGLWEIGSSPLGLRLHVAFEVTLDDVLAASRRLRSHGVTPLSFAEEETSEPSVLGWMPAASVYFRDPDGHLLEYLALLEEEPRPSVGVVPYSRWTAGAPTDHG